MSGGMMEFVNSGGYCRALCFIRVLSVVVRIVKCRRQPWSRDVAVIEKECRILVHRPIEKRSFGTPRRRWEDDRK
jgi:hypothetical protein